MEFAVVLPSEELLKIRLNSKELKGKFLLARVFSQAQINDDACKEYFGLRYPDKDDAVMNWICPDDNMKSFSYLSTGFNGVPSNMQLAVRFFPKDPDLVFPTNEIRLIFRQHMKNLLMNEDLGCNLKTHAMLDSFLVQAELGDLVYQNKDKYSKYIADLEVHVPSVISSGTTLTENKYHVLVKQYHEKLRGIRSAQADIMYLSLVQKIPLYGYNICSVSDKSSASFFLAFSQKGIAFIYDTFIKKYAPPHHMEVYSWSDLVYNELERNTLKLGFFPQGGEFIERKIKIKSQYSQKGAYRLQLEIKKFKEIFLDIVDGENVFDSRKKARRFYTTRIPRKDKSISKKFNSFRSSLRTSLRGTKQRHQSNKENYAYSEEQEIRRVQSES